MPPVPELAILPPPVGDESRIDPVIQAVIDAYKSQSEATDRRQTELLSDLKRRDEEQARRDEKRDTQHEALVGAVTGLTTEVRGLAIKAPGRWELRALGAVAVLLILVVLGLYAQSRGQDMGRAIDDARRGMAPVSAMAEPDPEP
jgi:hypothetical protein